MKTAKRNVGLILKSLMIDCRKEEYRNLDPFIYWYYDVLTVHDL